MADTTREHYQTWSEFRYQIRCYERFAEAAAREVGLEPQQYQLLLAVRGFPTKDAPTIGDLAERLQLRHHSVVELLNRMEQNDLIERCPTGIGRAVEVAITVAGRRALDAVSRRIRPHLEGMSCELIEALSALVPSHRPRKR